MLNPEAGNSAPAVALTVTPTTYTHTKPSILNYDPIIIYASTTPDNFNLVQRSIDSINSTKLTHIGCIGSHIPDLACDHNWNSFVRDVNAGKFKLAIYEPPVTTFQNDLRRVTGPDRYGIKNCGMKNMERI